MTLRQAKLAFGACRGEVVLIYDQLQETSRCLARWDVAISCNDGVEARRSEKEFKASLKKLESMRVKPIEA